MIGYTPAEQAIRDARDEPPDTCWADPLSNAERRVLREKLARACKRFYNTPAGSPAAVRSQIIASIEMSDLHLDVTERAAVAA